MCMAVSTPCCIEIPSIFASTILSQAVLYLQVVQESHNQAVPQGGVIKMGLSLARLFGSECGVKWFSEDIGHLAASLLLLSTNPNAPAGQRRQRAGGAMSSIGDVNGTSVTVHCDDDHGGDSCGPCWCGLRWPPWCRLRRTRCPVSAQRRQPSHPQLRQSPRPPLMEETDSVSLYLSAAVSIQLGLAAPAD